MKIRFRNLTDYQKEIICNGCGPKGLIIKVPDFLFLASCNHHDFNYWIGCSRKDRAKADYEFLTWSLKDAGNSKYYRFWAKCYYYAVRWFGWLFFHWARKERDRDDLNRIIKEKENEKS